MKTVKRGLRAHEQLRVCILRQASEGGCTE